MDFQEYSTALAAIHASLHSSTARSERIAANEFLEALKSEQKCMNIMIHILTTEAAAGSPSHTESVRQLALSVLNDWIKNWWNRISNEDQLLIRQSVFGLLQATPDECTGGLRNKIAAILSNIAERQYPQHWPTFLDEVGGLWLSSTGSSQREVCVLTLRYVIEDCVDADFGSILPSLRRQDILTGLRTGLSPLLKTAYMCLQQCAVSCSSADPSGAEFREAVRLGIANLGLVGALASFLKNAEMCRAPIDFSVLTAQLLSVPAVQSDAVNVIYELTAQKVQVEEAQHLVSVLVSTPVTVLPQDLGDSLVFQRTYAEAIYQLISSNTGVLLDARSMQSPEWEQSLGKCLNLMRSLLEQPSRRLAASVITSWIRILKDPAVENLRWLRELVVFLLGAYLSKTMRVRWDSEAEAPAVTTDGVQHAVDCEEFDELTEYNEFRSNFNNQMRFLADVTTSKLPRVSAEFVAEQVINLIGISASLIKAPRTEGESAADTDIARRWEIILVVWGNVCAKLATEHPRNHKQNDDVKAAWSALFQAMEALLSWDLRGVCGIDTEIFSVLSCLVMKAVIDAAPVLSGSTSHLQAALESVARTFSDTPDVTSGSALVTKRRHAASAALAELCDTCSKQIATDVEVARAIVTQLISWVSDSTVSLDDRCSFREALVTLGETYPEERARSDILSAAMGPLVNELIDPSTTGIFKSTQSFLERVCADTKEMSTVSDIQRAVPALTHTLGSIVLAAKRVLHPILPIGVWKHGYSVTSSDLQSLLPFSAVWQSVLPALLPMIGALHSAWDPAFRGMVAGEASIVFCPSLEIVRQYSLGSTKKAPGSGQVDTKDTMMLAAADLMQFRQQLYHLFGMACTHKSFYVWSQRRTFLQELPAAARAMENIQLAYLMSRFVEPFVLNAPPCCYVEVSAFLSAFLPDTLARLGHAWGEDDGSNPTSFEQVVYKSCSLTAAQTLYVGITKEELETARLHMIGELTRSYSDLIAVLGMTRGFLAVATPIAVAGPEASPSPTGKGGKEKKVPISKKKKGHAQPELIPTSMKKSDLDTGRASEELTRQEQKEARRACVRELVMGAYPALTKAYVHSVTALLCLPNSGACRSAIVLARQLVLQSVTDDRLLPAVGRDLFAMALSVLLRQEKWSQGLEWELLELLQEIYCSIALGLHDSTATATAAGAGSSAEQKPTFTGPAQQQASLLPAAVLRESGAEADAISDLNMQLCRTRSSKRRRDAFKDFLSPVIEKALRVSAGAADNTGGGVFTTTVPEVLDIRTRLTKVARVKKQNKPMTESDAHFSLSSLFGDDDL